MDPIGDTVFVKKLPTQEVKRRNIIGYWMLDTNKNNRMGSEVGNKIPINSLGFSEGYMTS